MAESKNSRVAVVIGVGPGLGASLARRFAEGYAVAINARNANYLESLAGEIKAAGGRALAVPANVGEREQVEKLFKTVRDVLGPPEVLLYNAGPATWGKLSEISPEQFESDWRINAFGAFLSVKVLVPEMVARGSGVILFTGATAGVKAGPNSVAFGPAKFAVRGLAQSLARALGPKGIHVAWINIDGWIEVPGTQDPYAGARKPDEWLKPDAIAETYWHLAHQDRSAWSMELDLRPFTEKF